MLAAIKPKIAFFFDESKSLEMPIGKLSNKPDIENIPNKSPISRPESFIPVR